LTEGALIGWLIAIAPALALVRQRRAARRRSVAINRALHELRRPLQVMVLSQNRSTNAATGDRSGLLELALDALGQVDSALNGGRTPDERHLVSCRRLVGAACDRWFAAARRAGGSLDVYWDAGEALVEAEPRRVAQALDNLIANALEHGGPPFVLTASKICGRVRISLSDGGCAERKAERSRRSPRRGHGLAVVEQVAREHGGRFAIHRADTGAVAAFELPLAGGDSALAA